MAQATGAIQVIEISLWMRPPELLNRSVIPISHWRCESLSGRAYQP
jgi:hypothetical protein